MKLILLTQSLSLKKYFYFTTKKCVSVHTSEVNTWTVTVFENGKDGYGVIVWKCIVLN